MHPGWRASPGDRPGGPAFARCWPAGPGAQGLCLFSRVTSCFVCEGIWAKTKITVPESGLVLGQWPQGPFRRCHTLFVASQRTVPVPGCQLSVPWLSPSLPVTVRAVRRLQLLRGRIVTFRLHFQGTEAPAGAAASRGSCAPLWGLRSEAGRARGGPAGRRCWTQTVQALQELGVDVAARCALTF